MKLPDEINNKDNERDYFENTLLTYDKQSYFKPEYFNYNYREINYFDIGQTEFDFQKIDNTFFELNSNDENSSLNNSNNDKDSLNLLNDINKYLFYNNNSIFITKPSTNENEKQKRRNIFAVIHQEFNIFNQSDYDTPIRKFINNIFYKEKKYKMMFFSKEKKCRTNNRKICDDLIRKKIKARFLKILKKTINNKLKLAGSKKFFNLLQQKFISNTSREMNGEALDLTFKEIFSKNFCSSKGGCEDDANMKKYNANLSVLDYLEKNNDISKKSNYSKFKGMKYYQIFEEYLNSKEFEIEISCLRMEKGVDDKYIKKYIKLAYSLNNYFSQ
jgi:hypothetical protein